MARKVGDFQLSVIQEFFKIQMTDAYPNNWISVIATIVENKFAANDQYKQNYQGIHELIHNEGVENLDEKKMDITSLTSLMLHDVFTQCKVGTNFRQHINNIRNDKNKLVSHISDSTDVLNVKILELTALKNLRSFLTYLQNSTWAYSGRQEFVDGHLAELEAITSALFEEVRGEHRETVEFESNRNNYLTKLADERAANAVEYIPLSYKIDDGTSQRFALEELFSSENNQQGFVIFSEKAGYGKTWSIQELAGRCAEEALSNTDTTNATPILIRMGELAVHEEPIMKAIQEILYPGEDNLEKARNFVNREPVLLFIDGMDEAEKDNKKPAWRELNKLLSSAKNIRIIGGTRESDKQWYPSKLLRYSICDLSDKQVEDFINKLITDKTQKTKALYDYFENPGTSFLKNLRCPFYLKCFVDFVKEGESAPDSDTDMMNRLINKMIEREIALKGFNATVQIVNDYLTKLSELIGNERRYIPEQEALIRIKRELIYDEDAYASVAQINDTLVELQILKEVTSDRHPALLGFWHEKYKSLFSPIAVDISQWDW